MSFIKLVVLSLSVAASALTLATPIESARDVSVAAVGQATYFHPGLGACGIYNSDADYVAAVSTGLFDTYPGYTGGNPNNNPICGRNIRASYEGRTVTVAITDRCYSCAYSDLDFSPSAFGALADLNLGRISGVTWEWI